MADVILRPERPTAEVVLHPEREASLRRRHPWLLSGAVARVAGSPAAGACVRVLSASGELLGHGDFSPRSQIRVRVHHFGKEEPGADWLERRIADAVARRADDPLLAGTDAIRLVNAEGDGLPGLVVDRYADLVVARLSAVGMESRREAISAALHEATGASAGLERADAPAARREGFAARSGALFGTPPAVVEIDERGRRYRVDPHHGQKTGFYLDQRDARDCVERLARGRRVLDAFSHTGGFALAAARGGAASVTLVESSEAALDRAREHLARAGASETHFERADAFAWLRAAEARFDLLVLDPPPLARRRADLARAGRALRDLVHHALRRAAPGARLLVFRCSHAIGSEGLRRACFAASLRAGRPLRVLGELALPSDHPVALDHPEGDYYSGLLLEA